MARPKYDSIPWKHLVALYEGGMSVRALASAYDLSYGYCHQGLANNGATFRNRGNVRGAQRRGPGGKFVK